MRTRNGVYWDLDKSTYRSEVNGLVFVFSSELHKSKFDERLKENRKTINDSLSKRFNIKCDVSNLADVVLYRKIETRGFLIEEKEDSAQCQKHLKFVGGKVTLTNYKG